MSYQKIADLIWKLHEKTSQAKVKWEVTADEGVYQAIFAGYAIRISKKAADIEPDIILQIYNEEGELIEEVNDREVTQVPELPYNVYNIMLNLYETARRIAMGTEQAINKILDILGEDDIPF